MKPLSLVRSTAILCAVLLLSWQVLYIVVGDVALRSPLQTFAFTATFVATPQFVGHATETFQAFALALAIAVAAGLAAGLALGASRLLGDVLEPVLAAFYAIPKITLYPILLLAFGLGMASKVAFGAIHGVIPVALFTLSAVRKVRPVWVKSARIMALGAVDTTVRVLVPAALPEIFSGLRIGFSLTLIGTLLGEMFASQRGLGFLLMNAIGLHNVDLIMALTLMLSVVAGAASVALLALERRLERR